MKTAIKSGIPEKDLQRIVFSSEHEIHWEKPGKEFRVGNRLFDVIRYEKTEEGLVFTCINDIQESQLFANLDELVRSNVNDQRSSRYPLTRVAVKLLSQVYLPVEHSTIFTDVLHTVHHTAVQASLACPVIETPSPPPDNRFA